MSKDTTKKNAEQADKVIETVDSKQCGIVMPIAQMTQTHLEYTENHWSEVYKIICEACEGYNPRLVSESKTSGMILTDIVQNLYKDDIVICDISGRNPNVFFELGMRLTFDKPTIVLKDDATTIPFDIQGVRMIIYPVGLNYHRINKLKEDIKDAITDTFEDLRVGKVNTFLKHFKDFNIQPSKLDSQDVTKDEARFFRIENQLTSIMKMLSNKIYNKSSLPRTIEAYDWSNFTDKMMCDFIETLGPIDKQKILDERNIIDSREYLHDKMMRFMREAYDIRSFYTPPQEITAITEDKIKESL